MDTHRQCHKCNVTMPIDMFQLYNAGRRRRTCRLCRNAQQRALEEKRINNSTPEYQEYLAKRREQANFSRINSLYSLSQDEYDQMFIDQCGVCAICSKEETRTRNGKTLRLCIDHDAETGQIRGLLCSRCNVAIGMMGHDPVLVSEAVNYLLKYQQGELGGQ